MFSVEFLPDLRRLSLLRFLAVGSHDFVDVEDILVGDGSWEMFVVVRGVKVGS